MAELLLVLFEEPTMLLNHVLCYTSHTLQNTFLNLITQNIDSAQTKGFKITDIAELRIVVFI